jgi:hypothetical protein
MKSFSMHSVVKIGLKPLSTKATNVCQPHDEKLKLFCINSICRKPICVLCATHGEHKGHETRLINDVVNEERKSVEAKIKLLDLLLDLFQF